MPSHRIRVHIENTREGSELYRITPALWEAACSRHRRLARRLDVTIGSDGDVIGDALGTAAIMIGVPANRSGLARRAPRLKWIHTTWAGVDEHMPLDWLPASIALTNNRGAHGAKAEQYMRMAYTVLHTRMPEIVAQQHRHRWRQIFTGSLKGKTALVIGLGDLGQAAARAARQVGMKVTGVSRSGKKVPGVDRAYRVTALDRLLSAADFVAIAVPLTAETDGLIGREQLARMKPHASLINIARASVIDGDALREKLARGELAGAMLDVVDPEPLPPDSPLWDTPNLMITPHISCDDAEHYIDITLDLWFQNLARFVAGRPLKNRVDPRRGY